MALNCQFLKVRFHSLMLDSIPKILKEYTSVRQLLRFQCHKSFIFLWTLKLRFRIILCISTFSCPVLLLIQTEVVIMQEFSFSIFYRKISVRDVAFAICRKHMADIVRSGEQVFVTHVARLLHLWRQHAENSLLSRPVVAVLLSDHRIR